MHNNYCEYHKDKTNFFKIKIGKELLLFVILQVIPLRHDVYPGVPVIPKRLIKDLFKYPSNASTYCWRLSHFVVI